MNCEDCGCGELTIPVGTKGDKGDKGDPGTAAPIVYFSTQSNATAGSYNSTTDTLIYTLPITTTGTYLVTVSGTCLFSKVTGYSTNNYFYLKNSTSGASLPTQTINFDSTITANFQIPFSTSGLITFSSTGNIELRGYMSIANTSTTYFNNVFIQALKVA